MWSARTLALVDAAIDEDLDSRGDITARWLPDRERMVDTRLVARQAGTLCGLALAPAICDAFSRRLELARPLEALAADGVFDSQALSAGATAATVRGPLHAVLTAERTLLNFLTRLSGVATLTRRYLDEARTANSNVQVLDTRKTLPGWRELDKYAVRCGGGVNHRFGLHDAMLIKDNHLAGVPIRELRETLQRMVQGGRALSPPPAFIEVEVDRLEQLEQALGVDGLDLILLDNFGTAELARAVRMRDERGLRGKIALEASGGVSLETIAEIAATGVERISVGAITHSAPALDLALDR